VEKLKKIVGPWCYNLHVERETSQNLNALGTKWSPGGIFPIHIEKFFFTGVLLIDVDVLEKKSCSDICQLLFVCFKTDCSLVKGKRSGIENVYVLPNILLGIFT
jgi:hypothetical protein